MARTPDNLSADAERKAAARDLLADGVDRAEVVKRIAADHKVSERTARRIVKEVEPHAKIRPEVIEEWEARTSQQRSRIVADIKRLDYIIEACIESANYKAIGSLQAQKTALYKMHASAHPNILWFDPQEVKLHGEV